MSSNPPPDSGRTPFARLLGAADEGFFKFESALNLIAALVILAVMFIGVFQVFGRKLINLPVPGYVDVIEFVMTVFAFISIAYTQRLGGHVRMEIIIKRFRGRALWIVEFLGTLTVHRHRRDPRVVRIRAFPPRVEHRRQHDRHRDPPLASPSSWFPSRSRFSWCGSSSSSSVSCGSRPTRTRSRWGSPASRPSTNRPSTRSTPASPVNRTCRT